MSKIIGLYEVMNLGLNEIFAVIDKVKSAELDGFEYSDVDMKIKIKNSGGKEVYRRTGNPMPITQENAQPDGTISTAPLLSQQPTTKKSCLEAEEQSASFAENNQPTGESVFVESPMVGTFYVAPSEGADPFVAVGERVKRGQVIGIIEAMKFMNEIEANENGIVEEVLVENETMVEFGQPILKIRKEI